MKSKQLILFRSTSKMSSDLSTEAEIEEAKVPRQEEWEKVRKPEDSLESPEPVTDSGSLCDTLQEHKQKNDLEFKEALKLKNSVKGLDDNEIDSTDLADRPKLEFDSVVVSGNDPKKRKLSETEKKIESDSSKKVKSCDVKNTQGTDDLSDLKRDENAAVQSNTGLVCIGILPGLGHKEESSSDDSSVESDPDYPLQTTKMRFAFLKRKLIKSKLFL